MFDLLEVLKYVVREEGSDVHLKVGSKPLARIHGKLQPIEEFDTLEPSDTERVKAEMLSDPVKLAEFEEEHEVALSYSVSGVARFRVSVFSQRGSISVAMRVIPYSVKTVDQLGL